MFRKWNITNYQIGIVIQYLAIVVIIFTAFILSQYEMKDPIEPKNIVQQPSTETISEIDYDEEFAKLDAQLSEISSKIDALEGDLKALKNELNDISLGKTYRITFTEAEFADFAMLVQHEAGGESYECRLLTASAIVNRVLMDEYPDTLNGVIYDNKPVIQYTPVAKGLYKTASDLTIQACYEALTYDYAKKCFIFNNKSLTSDTTQQWFEKFEIVFEVDGVQFRRYKNGQNQ